MLYRTYRYSQWDGTQRIFELDADQLMDLLSEDILNHGDVMQALRDMMRQGLRDRDGQQMPGLRDLMEQHRDIIVKDEYAEVYTKLGGSRINAFTTNDQTFYIATVPSNKFELWAWMESDRLSDSVFREFYAERDVVHEERRLLTESTPTGVFQEQFNAMFWQSSPYSWPVIGWTSDLNSYTMEEAQRYFDIYYQPSNIVGVIVGDFDPDEIKPVIRRYFSRLQAGRHAPGGRPSRPGRRPPGARFSWPGGGSRLSPPIQNHIWGGAGAEPPRVSGS